MALTKDTILHAWKDEEFKKSLTPEDRAALPERPVAEDGSSLSDDQLEAAAGGTTPVAVASAAFAVSEIVD